VKPWLAVAIGGALGSLSRYGLVLWAQRWPWFAGASGTLMVNVVGSFIAGYISVRLGQWAWPEGWGRELLIVGFCGGFTTFSALTLDLHRLFTQGHTSWGVALLLAHLLLGALALLSGMWCAR